MRISLSLLAVLCLGVVTSGCGGSGKTTTTTIQPPQGNQPLSQQAQDLLRQSTAKIGDQSSKLATGIMACLKKPGTQAKKDCTVTYFQQIRDMYDQIIPSFQSAVQGAQGACKQDLQTYVGALQGIRAGMDKFIQAAKSGDDSKTQAALNEMLKSVSGNNLTSASKIRQDCRLGNSTSSAALSA